MTKQYLNTREAAEYTGFTAGTLANFRCRKVGCRYYKKGGKILHSLDDLDQWIKSDPVLTADSEGVRTF